MSLQEKSVASSIIQIDRTRPFDPVEFIDKGWTIVGEDPRALALTEVDLSAVRFETYLRSGESVISGNEKHRRLREAGDIPLDAKVFQTLWEDQKLISELWKKKVNRHTHFIFFDGTLLRHPGGSLCVLGLCWRNGQWHRDSYWFDASRNAISSLAVLSSSRT